MTAQIMTAMALIVALLIFIVLVYVTWKKALRHD